MTTTRQQRSPMGAFYRTPMGAFGPGGEEEVNETTLRAGALEAGGARRADLPPQIACTEPSLTFDLTYDIFYFNVSRLAGPETVTLEEWETFYENKCWQGRNSGLVVHFGGTEYCTNPTDRRRVYNPAFEDGNFQWVRGFGQGLRAYVQYLRPAPSFIATEFLDPVPCP